MSNFTSDDPFTLEKLRSTLIRLEDTIIFALIERAQFSLNKCIYTPGAEEFRNVTDDRSFLEYFLSETEKVHAKVRRYTSPDEYPFTDDLPEPVLPSLKYKEFLEPSINVNVNEIIMSIYCDTIVPGICNDSDDQNYGSSATKDIECLQALSRRIHYGKFIAESKFRDDKDQYTRLALDNDRDAINKLLTNEQVEKKLLERLRRKALVYGQTIDEEQGGSSAHLRIPVDVVVNLYEKHVIPLTKKVEVDYLIERGRKYHSSVNGTK